MPYRVRVGQAVVECDELDEVLVLARALMALSEAAVPQTLDIGVSQDRPTSE